MRAQIGYTPLNWETWMAADNETLPPVPPGVTVIMVWGMLGRGWSYFDRYYLDAIEVDELIAAIEATPEGSTVVLWFRSPGGIISGVPETAAALRELRESRKILAWTDDLCASAAYWLAAQCSRVDATQTADVGSIGVYIAFYDWTEYLAKSGIKLELFKAGRMKAMTLPGNPLSEEESDSLQALVDIGYKMFTEDVLLNREIDTETMQGQTFRGQAAIDASLVDGVWSSSSSYFRGLAEGAI